MLNKTGKKLNNLNYAQRKEKKKAQNVNSQAQETFKKKSS